MFRPPPSFFFVCFPSLFVLELKLQPTSFTVDNILYMLYDGSYNDCKITDPYFFLHFYLSLSTHLSFQTRISRNLEVGEALRRRAYFTFLRDNWIEFSYRLVVSSFSQGSKTVWRRAYFAVIRMHENWPFFPFSFFFFFCLSPLSCLFVFLQSKGQRKRPFPS